MASEIPTQNNSGSISYSSSASDPSAAVFATQGQEDASGRRSSQHPAANVTEPVNPSNEQNPLNSHHRPSIQGDNHQGLVGETTVRQGTESQNAPGKAGDVGEAAMGALGYGGSTVGRPKEDQGISEKIVNILGA